MPNVENPNAGQGSVVLDIGGDIGALIVTMPASMLDLEVEIIPTGTDARPARTAATEADHHHHADGSHHRHDDGAAHSHDDAEHTHAPDAPPHVAVVARPAPDGSVIHSLVYGELQEGIYDLYVRPHGEIRLTASVHGGQVTEVSWPEAN